MGPPKRSMQSLYASAEDWETHREAITRLYLHEKRSLQDVMECMALNHSFFATCVPWAASPVRLIGADPV